MTAHRIDYDYMAKAKNGQSRLPLQRKGNWSPITCRALAACPSLLASGLIQRQSCIAGIVHDPISGDVRCPSKSPLGDLQAEFRYEIPGPEDFA